MLEVDFTAFVDERQLARGSLAEVLLAAKAWLDSGKPGQLLVFSDKTGRHRDYDFRGSAEEVVARATPQAVRPGPGRPRLGIVSREVSLLPAHWAWLEQQPNGISATLRRLVDAEMKRNPALQDARRARDACHRFISTMAGDRRGFEEAARALSRGDRAAFDARIRAWPADIRRYARDLAAPWFQSKVSA